MAKQFAFNQFPRQRSAGNMQKRITGPQRHFVNQAGEMSFARTGFSNEQNRHVVPRGNFKASQHRAQFRRSRPKSFGHAACVTSGSIRFTGWPKRFALTTLFFGGRSAAVQFVRHAADGASVAASHEPDESDSFPLHGRSRCWFCWRRKNRFNQFVIIFVVI